MSNLQIIGGKPLEGIVQNQGAKNAVLPILSACILQGGITVLHNCPAITDVQAAMDILSHLGCRTYREGNTVTVDSAAADGTEIPDRLMREMRSSIIFLGAEVARNGKAKLSLPGGCELGARPVDLHLSAMEQLGAECIVSDCHIYARRKNKGSGKVILPFPSVGATENAMLLAGASPEPTRIIGAAKEPEIIDLQGYLNALGYHVTGAGTDVITVAGQVTHREIEYSVLPDRISAATVLCCGAAAGGDVTVTHTVPAHLETVITCLSRMGCDIRRDKDTVRLIRNGKLTSAGYVSTGPYPGFPTDSQPPLMACCLAGQGKTFFRENIFENRYRYVSELRKMGGDIHISGRTALVRGSKLTGGRVQATDLRGGAALCVAALAAEGCSTISGLHHLYRGYEAPEAMLRSLGAEAKLLPDE